MLRSIYRSVKYAVWIISNHGDARRVRVMEIRFHGLRAFWHRLFGVAYFPSVKFEVNSSCQLDCAECAHRGMRAALPYPMTMTELSAFIAVTRDSGYRFGDAYIHGAGEPLLWPDFNEGVRMLYASKLFDRIVVVTNGLALDRIEEDVWGMIGVLYVSKYPSTRFTNGSKAKLRKYRCKTLVVPMNNFVPQPSDAARKPVPCLCMCGGPMFAGGSIYPHCGPTCADAARRIGKDLVSLRIPLIQGYMDQVSLTGQLPLCAACWANAGFHTVFNPHISQRGT